jgi:hypothetical protein
VEIKKIQEGMDQLGQVTKKITQITRYEIKEHTGGFSMIDIDKASSLEIDQQINPPGKSFSHARGVETV